MSCLLLLSLSSNAPIIKPTHSFAKVPWNALPNAYQHVQSHAHTHLYVLRSVRKCFIHAPNKDIHISIDSAVSDGCYNYSQIFAALTSRQKMSILIVITLMTANEQFGFLNPMVPAKQQHSRNHPTCFSKCCIQHCPVT